MSVRRIAAAAFRVIFTVDLSDFSVSVFLAAGACHKIRALKTNFITRIEALILWRGGFHEVIRFNIQLTRKAYLSRSGGFIQGIIFYFKHFRLPFRVVRNDKLDGIENCHNTFCIGVQIISEAAFEQRPINCGINLGNADFFAEVTN